MTSLRKRKKSPQFFLAIVTDVKAEGAGIANMEYTLWENAYICGSFI